MKTNQLSLVDLRTQENLRNFRMTNTTPLESLTDREGSFIYQPHPKNQRRSRASYKAKFRKSLPLVSIIAITFGIIAFFNYISSPLTTLARLAMDNFNTQDLATDTRMNQLLNYKLTASPDQTTKYQILDEYYTITPGLEDRLRKEGVELNQTTKTAVFKQSNITGDQFLANINSDLKLNKAINDATTVRRALFQDKTWLGVKQKSNLTQSGISIGNVKQTIQEQEMTLTKSNTKGFRFNTGNEDNQAINQFGNIAENLTKLNQSADQLEKDRQTPNGKNFVNLIFVDQPNESCSLYQTISATQNYQKTAQAEQLSKLAALLLSEADKIKAGDADSEVTNYLNDRLTHSGTYIDGNGQVQQQRSAMDSYTQRYLSGNSLETPDSSAQKYIIGANEPLAKTMQALQDNGQSDGCDSANTWTDFKNFFVNIWHFLTGTKPDSSATNYLTEQVKLNTTSTSLSAMTGLATAPDFSGEDLANGFASGVAELMAKSAQRSGMMALTKTQAIAYLTNHQSLIARRAEIDQQTLSPFDIRSPHTFLGNILFQFSTIAAKSSILNQLALINRMAWRSITYITKPALAAAQHISHSLEMCHDQEYLGANSNIALGPYCNLIYGATVRALAISPEVVISKLVESGNLEIANGSCDSSGNYCRLNSAGDLKEFEKSCINRQIPIGIEDATNNRGAGCVANSETEELFAVYLTDKRINQNLKK